MISAIITQPQPGDTLTSDTTFNVSVQTTHLAAGNFVNPTTSYYTAPQDLDDNGDIIGHCHVTIQDIGSLQATTPPDPTKFAFFKGIDDAGNGRGLLQAVVQVGLPPGVYRMGRQASVLWPSKAVTISPSRLAYITLSCPARDDHWRIPKPCRSIDQNGPACVATTGAKGGVSCNTFSNTGLVPMDELRAFGLGQVIHPVGPTNTREKSRRPGRYVLLNRLRHQRNCICG
ncbi:hypothetical protein PLICBS_003876 [Purpureocillium lilacinum]|uniref:uncharacterized protein n=1 Tax=Purpureocillium lilacinum TaxID=33203 RepID=UPI0020832759|nr:hypothetical protein PLICBS_003876 [Purpureocillium lilacinum]